MEGKGVMQYKKGNLYDGCFLKNNMHGYGTFTWNNGDKYQGEWKDGNMDGKGEYFYASDKYYKKYSGNWKKGKRCGKGVMQYKNDDLYDGCYLNNNRHGYGKMYYENGDTYFGIWENNNMNVLGRYDFSDGTCYIGSFKNGDFDGFGVLYKPDGYIHFGYFENNICYDGLFLDPGYNDPYLDNSLFTFSTPDDGQYFGVIKEDGYEYGIYILDNGEIYLGDFYYDDCCGYGVFLSQNKFYYRGQVENNTENGLGYMYYADGMCIKANWIDGKPYNKVIYDIDGSEIK